MAVNGGKTGTKRGPNWGHVKKGRRIPEVMVGGPIELSLKMKGGGVLSKNEAGGGAHGAGGCLRVGGNSFSVKFAPNRNTGEAGKT